MPEIEQRCPACNLLTTFAVLEGHETGGEPDEHLYSADYFKCAQLGCLVTLTEIASVNQESAETH